MVCDPQVRETGTPTQNNDGRLLPGIASGAALDALELGDTTLELRGLLQANLVNDVGGDGDADGQVIIPPGSGVRCGRCGTRSPPCRRAGGRGHQLAERSACRGSPSARPGPGPGGGRRRTGSGGWFW